ncbi:MAG TPA: ATP-binding protein [Candidatus Limnocylindrales bacterium]|nr:ATP-binding protein [Candidatus Limnocylindrales bacterium]
MATILDPDDVALAGYLADAGRILGSSLDSTATLRQIADLIVPAVADWCTIDLLDAEGRLVPLALAHRDPRRTRLVEELRKRYPADPEFPGGTYSVARTGQAALIPIIDEERLTATARDQEQIDLLRELELRSWMCAPMTVAGKVLGTIGFAAAESGRTFEARHVAFAIDLAARSGAAIENARAFQTADRFRQILDAVAEAVFVLDPVTDVIQGINHGASALLGRSAHELAGHRLADLVEESDEALSRIVRSVREGRSEARTIPLHFLRDGAPPIPAEVLLQRVDLPGEPPTTVAIARDVRERQEAQGRLRRLAEAEHARAAELNAVIRAMGDGVIVCGADGRTILSNPAGRQMFPDGAETSYASILAQLHDPDGDAPRLGTHAGPVPLRSRSEPERWIEVATYPVADRTTESDPGGETILVLRDVTEQRQREAVRETFIGVLSHELRTPITTIFGGARVLSREDSSLDEATRREILDDVAEEAERLKRLVEDVVALNRFGDADVDIGREPVLLQRIVPRVVGSEKERWPGVEFKMDMPPGLPTVMADPTYLEQVVRNLLANAAKYGGQGTAVDVVVEHRRESDEVAVCVRDDGPGIELQEAERLFDLFYRSPNTATATTGAGIGLFVCARLVRAMGGRVWARPLPAGGAEFGFALRVMREE